MEKKGWRLVDPGSAAGLDASISKAADENQNWFGYYWDPTSIVGKYGLTMLDFGVPFGGKENWDGCIVKPEQVRKSEAFHGQSQKYLLSRIASRRELVLSVITLQSAFSLGP